MMSALGSKPSSSAIPLVSSPPRDRRESTASLSSIVSVSSMPTTSSNTMNSPSGFRPTHRDSGHHHLLAGGLNNGRSASVGPGPLPSSSTSPTSSYLLSSSPFASSSGQASSSMSNLHQNTFYAPNGTSSRSQSHGQSQFQYAQSASVPYANGFLHGINGHGTSPSSSSSSSSRSSRRQSPPSSSRSLTPSIPRAPSLSRSSSRARKVLLILDAQLYPLSPAPTGVPNAATLYRSLSALLATARSSPNPPLIIHTRNAGQPGEPDAPNSPLHTLALAQTIPPTEVVIDKSKGKNSAFAGTRLGEWVPPGEGTTLIVAGVSSDYGVRATCSAALGRGNGVVLVRGAHATWDRVEYAAAAPTVYTNAPTFPVGGCVVSSPVGMGVVTPAAKVEREVENELEEAGVLVVGLDEVPYILRD
ncbi:Isochorismatase hydrolase [Schizopora paradoxa]|uniref:Isochorismatase hydrolase n=1 Tax=Schizopora paradoxa TaxID=27342 RepID=A0A0H2S0D8_9AGAM|nr:Isochorismatase hydrolase [Schizopora paradoxa]